MPSGGQWNCRLPPRVHLGRIVTAMELSEWHLWFKRRGGRALRDLVMREWDPIGVSGAPEALDEYDGYLGRIADRLRREAPAEEIAELLGSFRTSDRSDGRERSHQGSGALWKLTRSRPGVPL
jgi:hypothetical protein